MEKDLEIHKLHKGLNSSYYVQSSSNNVISNNLKV
jgi:hypothetical protein